MTADSAPPFRILPALTDRNRPFWTGGEHGELRFQRCRTCARLVHPPLPACPHDGDARLAWEAVSGRARVASYTVNHQAWMPGQQVPYVVAIVEIEEQPDVRLTTNLVGCRPEDARIGMPVRVVFEHHADAGGDVWLPLFEADATREGAA